MATSIYNARFCIQLNIMLFERSDIKMALEVTNNYRDSQFLHDECMRCMNYHTILTMKDGSTVDGIIEGVEGDRIIVLVGEDMMEQECSDQSNQQRQFHGHRPRRRFRRFRRHAFPLRTLAALSLLQYPYMAPPFPFYNPYFPY